MELEGYQKDPMDLQKHNQNSKREGKKVTKAIGRGPKDCQHVKVKRYPKLPICDQKTANTNPATTKTVHYGRRLQKRVIDALRGGPSVDLRSESKKIDTQKVKGN